MHNSIRVEKAPFNGCSFTKDGYSEVLRSARGKKRLAEKQFKAKQTNKSNLYRKSTEKFSSQKSFLDSYNSLRTYIARIALP